MFVSAVLVLLARLDVNGTSRAPVPGVPDETRLFRRLMRDYESSTRPILNASQTLMIDFELTLTQNTDLVSSCRQSA